MLLLRHLLSVLIVSDSEYGLQQREFVMFPDVQPCSTALKTGWLNMLHCPMVNETDWRGGDLSHLPLAGVS